MYYEEYEWAFDRPEQKNASIHWNYWRYFWAKDDDEWLDDMMMIAFARRAERG